MQPTIGMIDMPAHEYVKNPVLGNNGLPVYFRRETLEEATEQCPEIYQIVCSQPTCAWNGVGIVSQHGYDGQELMERALSEFNELQAMYEAQPQD